MLHSRLSVQATMCCEHMLHSRLNYHTVLKDQNVLPSCLMKYAHATLQILLQLLYCIRDQHLLQGMLS